LAIVRARPTFFGQRSAQLLDQLENAFLADDAYAY